MATPLVFNDPYGVGAPDVIGNLSQFDIESVTFQSVTASEVTIKTRLNYNNGDSTMSTFGIGGSFSVLNIGDILFNVGGVFKYAIILHSHDGLLAGNLYQLSNGALTAFDIFGVVDPLNTIYRPNASVWANATGATQLNAVNGTSTATLLGGGPEIEDTVNFTLASNSPFLTDFDNSSFTFASANCGNDVIGGAITPEPASMAMIGAGIAALALLRRRKATN